MVEYYIELLERILSVDDTADWQRQGLYASTIVGSFRITVAFQGIYSASGQAPTFVVCIFAGEDTTTKWYAQIHRGALQINAESKDIPDTSGQYIFRLMRGLVNAAIHLCRSSSDGTDALMAASDFSYLISIMEEDTNES